MSTRFSKPTCRFQHGNLTGSNWLGDISSFNLEGLDRIGVVSDWYAASAIPGCRHSLTKAFIPGTFLYLQIISLG